MFRNLPIVLLLSAFAGCASVPKGPDWVNGASRQYPAEQFLVGRGEASNVEQAQERARADLAKVFEVSVAAESEDVQAYKSEGGGQYAASSSRRIVTRTDQIVRGIRIGDLWQDPATKNHHALAVLPRLQAATSLREEVGKRDEAIARYVAQARTETDPLARVGAAGRALDTAIERDGYQKSLKVVDITGRGVESEYAAARLRADLDELVKRVRIAPRAEGDADAERLARAGLANAGFLAETGEKPEYVLNTRLKLEDLGQKEGWYWNRGTVEVTLTEAANGRVRGAKSWSVKGSATDAATARTRALAQAETALKKDLRATLTGFAEGK